MTYYENSKGEITGRLYETGSGWAAEIGRRAEKVCFGFIATRGIKSKNRRAAEKFLFDNGCIAVCVA